jgi:hypothetical protein
MTCAEAKIVERVVQFALVLRVRCHVDVKDLPFVSSGCGLRASAYHADAALRSATFPLGGRSHINGRAICLLLSHRGGTSVLPGAKLTGVIDRLRTAVMHRRTASACSPGRQRARKHPEQARRLMRADRRFVGFHFGENKNGGSMAASVSI